MVKNKKNIIAVTGMALLLSFGFAGACQPYTSDISVQNSYLLPMTDQTSQMHNNNWYNQSTYDNPGKFNYIIDYIEGNGLQEVIVQYQDGTYKTDHINLGITETGIYYVEIEIRGGKVYARVDGEDIGEVIVPQSLTALKTIKIGTNDITEYSNFSLCYGDDTLYIAPELTDQEQCAITGGYWLNQICEEYQNNDTNITDIINDTIEDDILVVIITNETTEEPIKKRSGGGGSSDKKEPIEIVEEPVEVLPLQNDIQIDNIQEEEKEGLISKVIGWFRGIWNRIF